MDTQNRYFKAIRKTLYAVIATAVTALSAMSPAVYADDTDVFLGTADPGDVNVRPNILFILDTSGSMDTKDIADAPGKSRLDVMKEAMAGLLNSVNNVNVGLMTFNSEGGPVRYPVGFIDADADLVEAGGFNINKTIQTGTDDAQENINTLINPGQTKAAEPYLNLTEAVGSATPTTVTISMIADTDDAEETLSNGANVTSSGSLDAHATNDIGLRFRSVNVPTLAHIISAELIFTVDPDGTNNSIGVDNEYSTTNAIISGQNADSPITFNTSAYNIGLRPRTLQYQVWNNVPAIEENNTVTSPNLSLIIQEIVDRPGWVSGNNMVLFMRTLDGYRDFESCRDSCAKAPKLRITYTMDNTRIPKLVGLRFTDVRIPQGAEIRRAFLDFTAAATSNEAMHAIIRGENAADSVTFAEANNNISARPRTANGVDWILNSTEDWQANQRYESPDIKDVIQEVVNRADWCGGQNMSLIIEPMNSAIRMIRSFEGSGAIVDAPTLRIEFDTNTQNISAPNTGCIINQVTSRVINSFDDAEERVSNNTTTTTSNSLELIRDSGNNQYVGVRFRAVNIAKNSVIVNARLEFTADGTSTGGDTLTIRGHKIADSPAFASGTGNKNISNRINNAPTTASVTWNPPDWNTDDQVHSSPDIRTIIQEIVNQSGWAANNNLSLLISGTSTNMRRAASFDGNAAQAARLVVTLKQNLAGIPSVSTQTVRERLIQEVSGLRTVASTPTVNVYMEAMRYFRGMPVYWGLRRGGQTDDDRYGRVSHSATYAGGVLVQPTGCTNMDLNDSDCVDEIVKNGPEYRSPIVDACQTNYIVLLSDGFQNTYSTGDGINSLIASAPDPFPNSCSSADGGADCGLKLAEFAQKYDQRSDLEGDQTITTFTIGFAISTQMLKDMAAKGGGQYKNANNSAELISAFETFLGDILSRPTTFTAPTLTISAFNRLFNSNEIYISLFEPERSASWSGNVKKYFLCKPEDAEDGDCDFTGQLLDANGDDAAENGQIVATAVSDWGGFEDGPDVELGGAGAQVPDYADSARRVFTYTGTNSNLGHSSNLITNGNTAVTAAMLGVGSATDRTNLIQWIRGQDVDDEDGDGGTTDQRWAFGDPLHSAALTVNYGISSGDVPVTKLLLGTNDGGFRMVNAFNGQEEWMFIPPELLSIQKDLRDNPNGDHFYGMDGSPVAWINDNDGDNKIEPTASALTNDFVKIFVGQRRGGQNYYALDVSPTSTLTDPAVLTGVTPTLLWKINNATAGYSRLGQTWSKPFVTSILMNVSGTTVRKNVLIFGGGYDTVNDTSFGTVNQLGNAIYIADAETGARIWSASGTAGGGLLTVTDMKYSIPSDVRIIDMDGDGAIDRLYVGDMAGQVWRVDLTGPVTAGANTNVVVGKVASLSNTSLTTPVLADQRRIMFRPEVALINDTEFANGTYVALALTSGNREDPLSEDVHDRMYVLRDYVLASMTDTNTDHLADPATFHTITHGGSDLVDVTEDIQDADEGALGAASTYGWYVEFRESSSEFVGEKGITEGQILISSRTEDPPVFTFNTYIPGLSTESSACSVSLGSNRTYFVNLLNGTGTDIIEDVNSRSKVNESYGIASDIIVIQQQGQSDVSVGGGTTDPTNTDLGDSLLPIYIME